MQRVEKKVRIELAAEHAQFGLRQLSLQPGGVRLQLNCFVYTYAIAQEIIASDPGAEYCEVHEEVIEELESRDAPSTSQASRGEHVREEEAANERKPVVH